MGCLSSSQRKTHSEQDQQCLQTNGQAVASDLPAGQENNVPYYLKANDTFANKEVDPRSPFNKQQTFKLISSWRAIKRNISSAGVEMFVQLFKTNAELQSLFQGFKDIRSDDELRSNEALEYHATLVMTTLDDAITHIDNYDFVKNLLHRTGCSHVKFSGFEPDNFMAIKEPFLEAVKVTLGDRYTENMQNIYDVAITFILGTLVEGIKEGLQNQADANDNSAAVCPVKHD